MPKGWGTEFDGFTIRRATTPGVTAAAVAMPTITTTTAAAGAFDPFRFAVDPNNNFTYAKLKFVGPNVNFTYTKSMFVTQISIFPIQNP